MRDNPEEAYELLSPERLEADFPYAWQWLSSHRDKLEDRAGEWTDTNWFEYSRRQNLELFAEPKVLVPYMVEDLCAVYDPGDAYLINVSTGGYGIAIPDEVEPQVLSALLNSRLLSWVLRHYSRAWRGDWYAARKGNLVRLPFTQPDDPSDLIPLYEECRRLTAGLADAESDADQQLLTRLRDGRVREFDQARLRPLRTVRC